MNTERLRSIYESGRETGRIVVGYGVVGLTIAGGASGGAFVGYKAGDALAPDAHSLPEKIFEHGIELTTAGVLGAVGALVGFGVGVWMLDEDGMRNNF